MEAKELLPIELWTKIIKDLKLADWISVQNVCQLFWDIVQDFVALGFIKSDFYVRFSKLFIFSKKDIRS